MKSGASERSFCVPLIRCRSPFEFVCAKSLDSLVCLFLGVFAEVSHKQAHASNFQLRKVVQKDSFQATTRH
jgi:hypothetical protein